MNFANGASSSVAVYGDTTYLCGPNRINIINTSDVTAPVYVGEFGDADLAGNGGKCALNTATSEPILVDIVGPGSAPTFAVYQLDRSGQSREIGPAVHHALYVPDAISASSRTHRRLRQHQLVPDQRKLHHRAVWELRCIRFQQPVSCSAFSALERAGIERLQRDAKRARISNTGSYPNTAYVTSTTATRSQHQRIRCTGRRQYQHSAKHARDRAGHGVERRHISGLRLRSESAAGHRKYRRLPQSGRARLQHRRKPHALHNEHQQRGRPGGHHECNHRNPDHRHLCRAAAATRLPVARMFSRSSTIRRPAIPPARAACWIVDASTPSAPVLYPFATQFGMTDVAAANGYLLVPEREWASDLLDSTALMLIASWTRSAPAVDLRFRRELRSSANTGSRPRCSSTPGADSGRFMASFSVVSITLDPCIWACAASRCTCVARVVVMVAKSPVKHRRNAERSQRSPEAGRIRESAERRYRTLGRQVRFGECCSSPSRAAPGEPERSARACSTLAIRGAMPSYSPARARAHDHENSGTRRARSSVHAARPEEIHAPPRERVQSVDHHQIQIALEAGVLESVIEKENVRPVFFLQQTARPQSGRLRAPGARTRTGRRFGPRLR